MSITLDEINEYEERLRAEIIQREYLLAALGVFRTYSAKGQWPESLDLGSLTSTLIRPARELTAQPTSLPAPAPPSLPPPPPPKPYLHPELTELKKHGRASHVALVRWAMGRMTEDFSLADIRRMLEREGYPVGGPEISVVLTRWKRRGEIEEIKRAHGPIPAVFRKPQSGVRMEAEEANAPENTEVAVASAVG